MYSPYSTQASNVAGFVSVRVYRKHLHRIGVRNWRNWPRERNGITRARCPRRFRACAILAIGSRRSHLTTSHFTRLTFTFTGADIGCMSVATSASSRVQQCRSSLVSLHCIRAQGPERKGARIHHRRAQYPLKKKASYANVAQAGKYARRIYSNT